MVVTGVQSLVADLDGGAETAVWVGEHQQAHVVADDGEGWGCRVHDNESKTS